MLASQDAAHSKMGDWNLGIRVIEAPFLLLSHGSPSFPSSGQAYSTDDQEVVFPVAAWEYLLVPFPNLPPERWSSLTSDLSYPWRRLCFPWLR